MACFRPWTRIDMRNQQTYTCPCGKCIGCKKDNARHWAERLQYESLTRSERGLPTYFVTLTYNDSHLPANLISGSYDNPTLSYHEARLFLARLRENSFKLSAYNWRLNNGFDVPLPKDVRPRFKVFLVGEYGGKFNRPHYHMILFADDLVLACVNRAWHKGHVDVRPVSPAACRYCTKYMEKQLYGELQLECYIRQGYEPPFSIKSPGIGAEYMRTHGQLLLRTGHTMSRYYADKFGLDLSYRAQDYLKSLSDGAQRSGQPVSVYAYNKSRIGERSAIRHDQLNGLAPYDYTRDTRSAESSAVAKHALIPYITRPVRAINKSVLGVANEAQQH